MDYEKMKAYPNNRSEGMDLRDYFAAKAMQADLTNYDGANWKRVAVQAYQMADAVMKAREQKDES
jgi:hypothetical protein